MVEVGPCEVTVAGHACLDFHPKMSSTDWEIESGQLKPVGGMAVTTGGTVPNVGLALSRLGQRVNMICKAGNDLLGQMLKRALEERAGESRVTVRTVDGEETSYTMVRECTKDRAFYHCYGANNTFCSDDIDWESVQGSKVFHFGYPPLMRSMYLDEGEELKRVMLSAKTSVPMTSLDMACVSDPNAEARQVNWERILRKVLPYVDFFVPSVDEVVELVGGRFSGLDPESVVGCREVASTFLDWGSKAVMMKLGKRGLYLRTVAESGFGVLDDVVSPWQNRELISRPFEAEVVGKTGSGDAAIAGCIAAICRGQGPEQCLVFANGVSSCSVEAKDATSGILPTQDTQERIKSGWQPMRFEVETGWEPSAFPGVFLGPADVGR